MSTRPRRRRKRSDIVADEIKRWIMDEEIAPGSRLPQERELIERFQASRGTIREALKSLEVQGLVTIRTGVSGGASVAVVSYARTVELLSNYFYSSDISLSDIYAVRKVLEPELAASVAGRLGPTQLRALEASIETCAGAPQPGPVSRGQRFAELDFHDVLADACPNPMLGFYCRFINSMLKNLAVCDALYDEPQAELTRHGHHYHARLLEALREGERARARRLMREHVVDAEKLMLASAGKLERRFLVADE